MAGISYPSARYDFDRYMRIAMDKNTERNTRLAAEALASAILNGATEVRSEAMEILIEEEEVQAITAIGQVIDGPFWEN